MEAKTKNEKELFNRAREVLQYIAEHLKESATQALRKNEDEKLQYYLKHKEELRKIVREIAQMEDFWIGKIKKRGRPKKTEVIEEKNITKEPKKRGRKKKILQMESSSTDTSTQENKKRGRKKQAEKISTEKPKRQRLKKGLKTPEEFFVLPILESLIELNGYARASDVIERIYNKVQNKLTEADKEPLKSNKNETRWSNTAKLCRSKLVKEGYLSKKSPHGFWEITEKGRAYYEELKKQQ